MGAIELSRISGWTEQVDTGDRFSIAEFAMRIDDVNPLHHDDAYCKRAGLEGVIVTGVRLIGYVSSAVAKQIDCAQVRRIRETDFHRPVYAGTKLTICFTVVEQRRISVELKFAIRDEEDIVAEGGCQVVLPRGYRN